MATTGRLKIAAWGLAAVVLTTSLSVHAQEAPPGSRFPSPPIGPIDSGTTVPTVPGVVPNSGMPPAAGVPLAPPMQNGGAPFAAPIARAPQAANPEGQLSEATEVAAIVGDQVILVGDMLPQILAALKQHAGMLSESELAEQRRIGVKQMLPNVIEQKLLYLDFLRSIDDPTRQAEINKKLSEAFDKTKLDGLMEQMQCKDLVELETKLREFNSSIEKQRRRFAEQQLAQEMVRRNVKHDAEITLDDMARYYHEHLADFDLPEKVRWEKLSSDFTKNPDKASAWRLVAGMGNRVLRGAPLAEVAKKESQGLDASDGGQHDWTQRGSLTSKLIEDSVFALPEGKLSQIIEDETGFHIIRVIERRAAGRVPFEEAQISIKEKLKKERTRKQIVEYLDGLKTKTRVWTMFDDELARKPGP